MPDRSSSIANSNACQRHLKTGSGPVFPDLGGYAAPPGGSGLPSHRRLCRSATSRRGSTGLRLPSAIRRDSPAGEIPHLDARIAEDEPVRTLNAGRAHLRLPDVLRGLRREVARSPKIRNTMNSQGQPTSRH